MNKAFWLDIDWDEIPRRDDGKPEPFWMHRRRDVIDVQPKAKAPVPEADMDALRNAAMASGGSAIQQYANMTGYNLFGYYQSPLQSPLSSLLGFRF